MTRKHILVVDDDAALRSVLTMRLEYNGHTVEAAETGLDALNRLAYADSVHADYDVVLLDYMMPGITGLMVLNHMQLQTSRFAPSRMRPSGVLRQRRLPRR